MILNKYLLYFAISISIISCGKNQPSVVKEEINQKVISTSEVGIADSVESKPTVKRDSQINIDEALSKKFGTYFMNYNNGVLSLCCFDQLASPFGSNQVEDIKKYIPNYRDSIYQIEVNGQLVDRMNLSNQFSDLTMLEFQHNDGFIEYSLQDSSYYSDSTIYLNNGLKIGMSKEEVFDKFFWTTSATVLTNLEMIAVCPDERGELFTQYRFRNGKLHSIVYGYEYYKINTSNIL